MVATRATSFRPLPRYPLRRVIHEWVTDAACRGEPPATFFPERERGVDVNAVLWRARAVCNSCPVSVECLHYALADPELEGVWAGTTTRERRDLRLRLARPAS